MRKNRLYSLRGELYQTAFNGLDRKPGCLIYTARIILGAHGVSFITIHSDRSTLPISVEDLERNDGSQERPYYMPKSLLKILGKKNEVPTGGKNRK